MPESSSTLLAFGALTWSAPLILAAMGGLTSERSGVMNIGLEGNMLTSACVTSLVGINTGNALSGLAAGILASIALSMLLVLLTQAYRLDHIIAGMALNVMAIGGTSFLAKRFSNLERSGEIPQIAPWIYDGLVIFAPLAIALYLAYTKGGLRLLAVGNDPEKSRQMGLNPILVRYLALLWTGILCGVAGAMIVSNAGRFSDGMTAGKGFIALAALIVGGWRPIQAALACLFFGLFKILQLQLQGAKIFGIVWPSELWNSLPYLVTIVALAGLLGRNRAPAGLGKP